MDAEATAAEAMAADRARNLICISPSCVARLTAAVREALPATVDRAAATAAVVTTARRAAVAAPRVEGAVADTRAVAEVVIAAAVAADTRAVAVTKQRGAASAGLRVVVNEVNDRGEGRANRHALSVRASMTRFSLRSSRQFLCDLCGKKLLKAEIAKENAAKVAMNPSVARGRF